MTITRIKGTLSGPLTLEIDGKPVGTQQVALPIDVSFTTQPPVIVPPPPPPPVVPPVTAAAWPVNRGLRLAGELAPSSASEPVGTAMLPASPIVRPAQNQRVSDPRFGGVTIRALVPEWVNTYSQLSCDSPDGKRLLLVKPDNGYQMFDRVTLAPIGTLPSMTAPRWLPDGRILYLAGSPYRALAIDPVTGVTSELYRTAYTFGSGDKVQEEVGVRANGDPWTVLAGYSSGSPDRNLQCINLKTGSASSAAFVVNNDAFNWARMTPDAQYLAIQWNASGTGDRRGVCLYDIITGAFVRQIAPEGHHGDWGVAPDGRVFYATHASAHPANGNYPAIVAYWADGAPPTYLRMVHWGVLHHVSCRGPKGWILVSCQRPTPVTPNGGAPDAPWELWLMHVTTGEVLRMAHHRSMEGSYWAEAHGTLLRDGTGCVFGSDWNGTLAKPQAFALEWGTP